MATINDLREERLNKLNKLRSFSVDPFPAKVERDHTILEAISNFEELQSAAVSIAIAGRLLAIRGHGGAQFLDLFDGSASIQLHLKEDVVGAESFSLFESTIDIGDFISVRGKLFTTKRGEKTIEVSAWSIISKTLRPLPEKYHGLKDEEARLRLRYLDLLQSEDDREIFRKKARFWEVARTFMKERGFIEVETPTLELTTGGAEARPFATHHHDYDMNVYLRISVGELWQKRLMAAGFPKTFEVGRVYRNEGSSAEHLQEFTNLEFYWAYANYEDGMALVEELYRNLAREVFGTTKFEAKGHVFDLGAPWPRLDFREEVLRQTGVDVLETDVSAIQRRLKELGVSHQGDTQERLTDTLWKHCRKQIAGPAFLVHLPKLIAPLAKTHDTNPLLTQSFKPLFAGSEMGNGYSELNDPIDQRLRFEEQERLLKAGDEEAMMPDWDFVEMLEYGMPPTCGFGFGERVFATLAGRTIRDCQLFPLVKPRSVED